MSLPHFPGVWGSPDWSDLCRASSSADLQSAIAHTSSAHNHHCVQKAGTEVCQNFDLQHEECLKTTDLFRTPWHPAPCQPWPTRNAAPWCTRWRRSPWRTRTSHRTPGLARCPQSWSPWTRRGWRPWSSTSCGKCHPLHSGKTIMVIITQQHLWTHLEEVGRGPTAHAAVLDLHLVGKVLHLNYFCNFQLSPKGRVPPPNRMNFRKIAKGGGVHFSIEKFILQKNVCMYWEKLKPVTLWSRHFWIPRYYVVIYLLVFMQLYLS